MLVGVLLFLIEEGNRVVAPMPQRVQVVRGVVAVVVAVAVALNSVSKRPVVRDSSGQDVRVHRSA